MAWPDPETVISDLPNLGPSSAKMLSQINVHCLRDIEQLGPVSCFKLLKAANVKVSLNLLYALYGAIHNKPWNRLSQVEKDDLIRAARSDDSPFK